MLDMKLCQSFLHNKLRLLLFIFCLSMLSGAANVLLFGGIFEGVRSLTLFGSTSGIFFTIGVIVFLFIQAYQDYYTGFPLAIYTGKTRGQFLVSSLFTSVISVMIATVLAAILIKFFSLQALNPKIEIDIAFLPQVELVSGLRGLVTMALFFTYQAILIHFIALLNYRFGAKAWIYISAFVISMALVQLLPFDRNIAPFVDFLSLKSWINVFGEGAFNYAMDLIRLALLLVLMSLITLKLTPILKE